jgi:hypothetical protein
VKVELSAEAAAQIERIDAWWRVNRPAAPGLFAEELERALLATRMREGLEDWMDKRGCAGLDDFRGTLSQRVIRDPGSFERAQYVHLILSQNG